MAQKVQLLLDFDTFRDNCKLQAFGERDYGGGRVVGIAGDMLDEGAIDLDHVAAGHRAGSFCATYGRFGQYLARKFIDGVRL